MRDTTKNCDMAFYENIHVAPNGLCRVVDCGPHISHEIGQD